MLREERNKLRIEAARKFAANHFGREPYEISVSPDGRITEMSAGGYMGHVYCKPDLSEFVIIVKTLLKIHDSS